jgi:hypothetical protein
LLDSQFQIHDFLSNYEALSLVEVADETNKMAVIEIYAPFLQDNEDLAAVDAFIGLRQVDEEHVIESVPLASSDVIYYIDHFEVRVLMFFLKPAW